MTEEKKKFKFVVDRRTWLRGEGVVTSALRRHNDGKQCCLGFLCKQFGMTDSEIEGHGMPISVKSWVPIPEWMRYAHGSADIYHISSVNDDTQMADKVREEALRIAFAKHGIEVKFVN